jgi:hypothetical protein
MAVHSKQIFVSNWIANEEVLGVIDGINKEFELINTPISEVIVRLNGVIQMVGIDKDYTITGKIINFIKAPKIGNEVVASYFKL